VTLVEGTDYEVVWSDGNPRIYGVKNQSITITALEDSELVEGYWITSIEIYTIDLAQCVFDSSEVTASYPHFMEVTPDLTQGTFAWPDPEASSFKITSVVIHCFYGTADAYDMNLVEGQTFVGGYYYNGGTQ